MLSAKAATQKANAYWPLALSDTLDKIENAIEKAADNGRFAVTYNTGTLIAVEEVVKILKKYDYSVTWVGKELVIEWGDNDDI